MIVYNKVVNVNTEVMQTTGLKRKTIDKFYTSTIIVTHCIQTIKQNINIQENDFHSCKDKIFIIKKRS